MANKKGQVMACKIKNISQRLVSIQGNSGQFWHIPPGISIEVMDVEISDNPKVSKLEMQNLIAVQRTKESPSPSEKSGSRKPAAAASVETSLKGE